MLRPARPPSESFLVSLAILLSLLHVVLGLTATVDTSLTHDEIAHLTAGRTYNGLGDFRLHPENGNLPQRVAALPLSLMGTPLPPLAGSESWRRSDIWIFGHQFFYEMGNEPEVMTFAGRAAIGLFGAGTGLLIFFWSRRLFGVRGAFLSLGLFVFCPSFLAHSVLATSDVTMTFFLLAAVTAWWAWLEKGGWRRAALSAAVFGLAFVAKFSAVLLLPIFGLLAALRLAEPPAPGMTRLRLGVRLAAVALGHAAAAWAIIWLFYGFRYSAFSPDAPPPLQDFYRPWAWVMEDGGLTGRAVTLARYLHALPEAFLFGFMFVVQYSQQRAAFLNGEYGIYGWPTFFPYAFLVKTTLPVLLLLAAGLLAWSQRLVDAGAERWRTAWAHLRPAAPLLVLFAIYWAISIASHLNIGHRHILPTYPVLFVLLGAFGPWLDFRRPAALALVAALALWHAVESVRIRPHYLAYFNPISGGPAEGWQHLVDSSLDWGQDLPGLARWLRAHNTGPARAPVFLSYFGTGEPLREGIDAVRLPMLPKLPPAPPWYRLGPGLYCVSATMLQGVYSAPRGTWNDAFETEYQQLHAVEDAFIGFQNDPAQRGELLKKAPAQHWTALWAKYDELRFARLCHYLRARRPEANIGCSIFIFRLSADEIAAATGSIHEWSAAIERALVARDAAPE